MISIQEKLSNKISIAVFVATIIVVLRHSINIHVYHPDIYLNGFVDVNSFVQIFINSLTNIAVPLFFILSGYFFFYNFSINKTFLYYRKRYKSLLIPYIIWNVLLFLFFILIQKIEFTSKYSSYEILTFDFSSFFKYLLVEPISGQLWYIRDLILFVILSPLIFYILKIKFAFLLLLFFLIFNWHPIDTSFFSTEGVLFYSVGAYLGYNKNNLKLNFSIWVFLFLLVVWLFLKLVIVNRLFEFSYLINIEKASIIIGVIVLWKSLDYFNFSKKIIYLASFSFFIYAFQSPLIKIFYKILLSLLPKSEISGLMVYFISPIFIISISIIVAKLLKSKMSSIYSLLTGNR